MDIVGLLLCGFPCERVSTSCSGATSNPITMRINLLCDGLLYHFCTASNSVSPHGARHSFVPLLRISSLSQTLQIIQSTLFCITFAQLIVCQTLPLLRNSSHLRESGDIILYHVCATHLHERGDIILYHVCARASLASMHS